MTSRLLPLLVLFLLGVPGATARAQQAGAVFELPPSNYSSHYQGVVVWQRLDGSVLRGYANVLLISNGKTRGQPNSLILSAGFYFGGPSAAFFYPYLFAGKMDPNRRGFLRYSGVGEGAYPTLPPALDPGKVPVLLTGKDKVMSGGVLAADGSLLTFRVDLFETDVGL